MSSHSLPPLSLMCYYTEYDPSGLFMGKIFHLRDLCYTNITFALFFSTGKMMNILSDFGKDEQVKKVALKTGISGKNYHKLHKLLFFWYPLSY